MLNFKGLFWVLFWIRNKQFTIFVRFCFVFLYSIGPNEQQNNTSLHHVLFGPGVPYCMAESPLHYLFLQGLWLLNSTQGGGLSCFIFLSSSIFFEGSVWTNQLSFPMTCRLNYFKNLEGQPQLDITATSRYKWLIL